MPRALWALTALHIGLLLAYSVLVPALRGPDEHLHVDRVRQLAPGELGAAAGGGRTAVSPGVLAARRWSPAYQVGSAPVAAGDAVAPTERPTFSGLDADPAPAEANPLAGQPPLAHLVGAATLVVTGLAPGGPWSFDRTVALLRLIEVAAVAALPVLAWATARRLGCPPRAALTAAALVLAVPQLTHAGATFGSDGLLVALGGVLFLLGARILTGDASTRTAVLAGAGLGAALLTGGLAVVFVPWLAGAYALAPAAAGDGGRKRRNLAVAGAVAVAAGGWWWLRQLVVAGHLPIGLDATLVAPGGTGGPLALPRALATLVTSYWGGFGWLEISLGAGVVTAATVITVGAVGVAYWRGRIPAVRRRLALLALPTAALATAVAAGSAVLAVTGSDAFAFQGRFLLPGLVGLAVVVAVGLDQLRPRPVPALPLLALFAALAMQALAVAALAQRFWAGPSAGDQLRAVLAFSPWPPVLVFFGAVGVLAVAAWAVVEVGRAVRDSLPAAAARPAASW